MAIEGSGAAGQREGGMGGYWEGAAEEASSMPGANPKPRRHKLGLGLGLGLWLGLGSEVEVLKSPDVPYLATLCRFKSHLGIKVWN